MGKINFYLTFIGASIRIKEQHRLRHLYTANQGNTGSHSFPTPEEMLECVGSLVACDQVLLFRDYFCISVCIFIFRCSNRGEGLLKISFDLSKCSWEPKVFTGKKH